MISKHIKLMRDYGCYPFWGVDEIENIDPASLPLSPETVARLDRWAQAYDKNLNLKDPSDVFNVPTISKEEAQKDEIEGLQIWIQVRNELAGQFQVSYFYEGKIIMKPEDHPLRDCLRLS